MASAEAYDEFQDPQAFERLMARLANKPWHLYAKRPFRQGQHLLSYLGRYTHRVAISNSRLVDVGQHAVTFRTKEGKTHTLTPIEFLRRFLLHVLPDAFKKIRHFGLYATAHCSLLELARAQLPHHPELAPPAPPQSWAQRLRALTGRDVTRCPRCGGLIERIATLQRLARAPPKKVAA